MRRADWTDADGRNWATLLPDGAIDAEASRGVPLGPPSLATLGLPLDVEVRLHNQLHAREIWGPREAGKRIADVRAALEAALKVDVQTILAIYADDGG